MDNPTVYYMDWLDVSGKAPCVRVPVAQESRYFVTTINEKTHRFIEPIEPEE